MAGTFFRLLLENDFKLLLLESSDKKSTKKNLLTIKIPFQTRSCSRKRFLNRKFQRLQLRPIKQSFCLRNHQQNCGKHKIFNLFISTSFSLFRKNGSRSRRDNQKEFFLSIVKKNFYSRYKNRRKILFE